MKRLESFSQHVRSVLGLFLILVFLGLGSCPAQKSFHALMGGASSNAPGQKGPVQVKRFLAKTCLAADNNFSFKLSLPERPLTFTPPFPSDIFLAAFLMFSYFLLTNKGMVNIKQNLAPVYLDAVPVYLRNRSLLI